MRSVARRVGLPLVAAFALVLGAAGPAKADLVLNGDFETGTQTPWSFINGGVSTTAQHSGTYGATSNPGTIGILSQTIDGLTVGNTYTLDFWLRNANTSVSTSVDVDFGSAQVVHLVSPGTSGVYASYSYQVTATSASQFLRFTLNSRLVTNSYAIDDITLTDNGPAAAAPEPSAIAMMASALPLGIGYWFRRRKRSA